MKPLESSTYGIDPHGVIAWHTLGLLNAIAGEERLVLSGRHRRALADLLAEASASLAQAADRLRLTPLKAETLRQLQNQQPKHLN